MKMGKTYYKAFDTLMKHDLSTTVNTTSRDECVDKAFFHYMMSEFNEISTAEKEQLLDNHGIIILQRGRRYDDS